MPEEPPKQSWWQTLPGILTGITAIITALGGLIVAVNQTSWFSRHSSQTAQSSTEASAGTPPGETTTQPQQTPSTASAPSPAASAATAGDAGTVVLPKARDYTLGTAVFTLLEASLAPRNSEGSTLTVRVRLTNNGRYGVNFWDSEFRLLVDGVPRAPNSGLNELVEGNAAGDGDVTFIVPRTATDVRLRILFADEKTDIPLALVHPG